MKLLPKHLIKTEYTYRDYFDSIQKDNQQERLELFKQSVLNKRGITIYNQTMIKIEDIIVKNPYEIEFSDKSGKNWNVGDYLTNKLKIKGIENEEIPIAVRIIDKGGKLKGDERKYIHIPCQLLAVVGNVFGEKIDIKQLIQSPNDKLEEIEKIRKLIEINSKNSQEEQSLNYLGTKFESLTIDGQIIKPPLIIFGDKQKQIGSLTNDNSIDLRETIPYSKVRQLNKIDIYSYDLTPDKYETIWQKLQAASKELGIELNNPMFYSLEKYDQKDIFESYIQNYFNKCDETYSSEKKEDKPDFIFLFMDKKYKDRFHYSIFKSVINKFNWCIPTQVILYDDKKLKKTNLSQFTNILCQMWAKKGNELYICDFSFIPKTIVVAYSSMVIQEKKILTSISISIGTKLYEYMFYSKVEDNPNEDSRISPSIESLLKKALTVIGKHIKKGIENIVIYRDAVNEKQQRFVSLYELKSIENAIKAANEKLGTKIFADTKWCLILVSKINEVKMFLEGHYGGNNNYQVQNIPVGTIVDRIITHKEKYDFYLNSAESRQGTCSSTHYTILHDDTNLDAMQIYKLTYYLTYLSYNTTHSIRVPAPLYFVTRRNKFTYENLKGIIINEKNRTLNISL